MDEQFLRPIETARLLNVTTQTLINWSNSGRITSYRTRGKHRRFKKSDIQNLINGSDKEIVGKNICYCRVSSRGQKEDLERQIIFR